MLNRRDGLVLGGVAATADFAGVPAGFAGPASARRATGLFNFKDDVSPDKTAGLIAKLKDRAGFPGMGGLMVGRNLIPHPFPARFEWICMALFDNAAVKARKPAFEAHTSRLAFLDGQP